MERCLREELALYIDQRAKQGFKWGENDCALFANDMLVKFFNMPDVGVNFRGKYKNWRGAIKTFKELGYTSVADIPKKHGYEVFEPKLGDIALYIDGKALGICMGVYSWFLSVNNILVKIPTKDTLKVWRYA